nr:T9SS type A sorting domain-containing protein [Lewinella sp. JB7]
MIREVCGSVVEPIYRGESQSDPDENGTYTLTRTWVASDSCEYLDSCTQVITVHTVVARARVSLYPNPARDLLTVRFGSTSDQRIMLEVVDALGRRISNRVVHALPGDNQVELNVGNLPGGHYRVILTPAVGRRSAHSFLRVER